MVMFEDALAKVEDTSEFAGDANFVRVIKEMLAELQNHLEIVGAAECAAYEEKIIETLYERRALFMEHGDLNLDFRVPTEEEERLALEELEMETRRFMSNHRHMKAILVQCDLLDAEEAARTCPERRPSEFTVSQIRKVKRPRSVLELTPATDIGVMPLTSPNPKGTPGFHSMIRRVEEVKKRSFAVPTPVRKNYTINMDNEDTPIRIDLRSKRNIFESSGPLMTSFLPRVSETRATGGETEELSASVLQQNSSERESPTPATPERIATGHVWNLVKSYEQHGTSSTRLNNPLPILSKAYVPKKWPEKRQSKEMASCASVHRGANVHWMHTSTPGRSPARLAKPQPKDVSDVDLSSTAGAVAGVGEAKSVWTPVPKKRTSKLSPKNEEPNNQPNKPNDLPTEASSPDDTKKTRKSDDNHIAIAELLPTKQNQKQMVSLSNESATSSNPQDNPVITIRPPFLPRTAVGPYVPKLQLGVLPPRAPDIRRRPVSLDVCASADSRLQDLGLPAQTRIDRDTVLLGQQVACREQASQIKWDTGTVVPVRFRGEDVAKLPAEIALVAATALSLEASADSTKNPPKAEGNHAESESPSGTEQEAENVDLPPIPATFRALESPEVFPPDSSNVSRASSVTDSTPSSEGERQPAHEPAPVPMIVAADNVPSNESGEYISRVNEAFASSDEAGSSDDDDDGQEVDIQKVDEEDYANETDDDDDCSTGGDDENTRPSSELLTASSSRGIHNVGEVPVPPLLLITTSPSKVVENFVKRLTPRPEPITERRHRVLKLVGLKNIDDQADISDE